MERSIWINGEEQTATYNMRTGKIYRELCGSDLIKDVEIVKGKMMNRLKKPQENDDMITFVTMLADVAGEEFLEHIVYSCIRTTAEMSKKRFMTLSRFIDSYEDPNEFYAGAYIVYDMLLFGNRQIVEPEKSEESKDDKKKKE